MLADRINQLDHLTRGRVMFGVGPGALPSDAFMMGIDVAEAARHDGRGDRRARAAAARRGRSRAKTDWFTLRDARLQLPPYTLPARRDLRRLPDLAGRRARRRQVRPRPALDRRHHDRRLQRARQPTGRSASERAKEFDQSVRPRAVAPRRPDAHRRDPRAGRRGREVRPREVALLLPATSRRCRSRRAGSVDERGRGDARLGPRRDRHARRRRRPSSSGSGRSRAATAPSCSWTTTGPTGRASSAATSSSRAT